jgi:hypothetical protein
LLKPCAATTMNSSLNHPFKIFREALRIPEPGLAHKDSTRPS